MITRILQGTIVHDLMKYACPSQAPATTLANKTRALIEEHGKAFTRGTMSSVAVTPQNVT